MAYHNHLAQELTLPQYAEEQLAENPVIITAISPEQIGRVAARDTGKPPGTAAGSQQLGGGPTWLNSAILRQQSQQFVDGSFLHLQTASDSFNSQANITGCAAVAGQWVSRGQFRGDDEAPASSDSIIAAAVSDPVDGAAGAGAGGDGEIAAAAASGEAMEGTWQNARHKAEILAHPLYEQLLSAHVACLRIATPVDQLPRIDAQLAQSQHVVSKYSVLGGGQGSQMFSGDDKELDQFMCALTKEELDKVGTHTSAKKMWEAIIELNEGTSEVNKIKKNKNKNKKKKRTLKAIWNESSSSSSEEEIHGFIALTQKEDLNNELEHEHGLELSTSESEDEPQPHPDKTHFVLLLCSFKEQLQQHVRVHAMEAVMACWELEQCLQSLTGVSPGEGTGATMSDDDDDDDQADSQTNFYDGSFDGHDSLGFGPLVPTESERTLMERVRQELKHELKQGYKEKIVDIREEILRKRRAGKLPGDTTSTLKAWWQTHSKWPYPTEDDKARLVQETGLQLKQINNWFINQRKRNWHNNPSSSSSVKSKRKR